MTTTMVFVSVSQQLCPHEYPVPMKIAVEEMIGKRKAEDKTSVGEKTDSMLTHCRYFLEFDFFQVILVLSV